MASNDPPSLTVTAVEHTEGTSYEVAFGDPARYSLPGSENYFCRGFPAAGGENPYQPEMGLLAPLNAQLARMGSTAQNGALMMQIGNAICVSIYDALRCVPERSRGLDVITLITNAADSNQEFHTVIEWLAHANATGGYLYASLVICFYRMCYRDGTLQAFAKTPDLATTSAPEDVDLRALYFNLSASERTRLREYANGVRRERRMPYILSRQLILWKAQRGGGPSGRFIRRNFLPDSDELFRVVVSFL